MAWGSEKKGQPTEYHILDFILFLLNMCTFLIPFMSTMQLLEIVLWLEHLTAKICLVILMGKHQHVQVL